MKPSEMIQTLITKGLNHSGKSISLRPGQIVHGKITKLFPNQTAEVQLGSHKVIAQLETPLSANSRYWFKVQPGEGMLRLKVIGSEAKTDIPSSIDNLLSQLSLPQSKENKGLVLFFLKEQLPITGEILQLVSSWLKDSESYEEGLDSVKELIVRQLPLTKEIFSSVSSAIKGDSLSVLMEKLLQQLKQIDLSPRGQKVSNLLCELTKPAQEKSGESAAVKLVAEWLFPKSDAHSHAAFNILKALKLVPGDASESAALLKAMNGLLSNNGSLNKPPVIETVKELLQSNSTGNRKDFILNMAKLSSLIGRNQAPASGMRLINEIQRMMLETRIGQNSFPAEEKRIQSIIKRTLLLNRISIEGEQGLRHSLIFGETALKQSSRMLGTFMAGENTSWDEELQSQERALLDDVKNSGRADSRYLNDQQSIKSQLKSLIHALGLSYEHELTMLLKQPEGDVLGRLNTLKPLLIGLLNEEIPQSSIDAAEKLLHKITGFQALSQESGPQQHLVFQLPIALWGKVTDLTMQWSGRKTDKGQIDPSYCRVLFYLNLEHLNETVVDLHVQNRVINITIINESETLKVQSAPYIASLKENLDKLSYKMSSISFQKPDSNNSPAGIGKQLPAFVQSSQTTGVDLKV
ncbi:hypothetical protein [Cytobacillus sp. NCCP-133]|uniref:hypothetical protein n=1 Tax=Cytobacillus sp. NCCP-133 TaxID=766848 RepID=UPI00222F687F|nr:hypothetical protein [Cytobacillus sp. NCCP-133]GLB59366.1 hypothetical protein NCCP133_14990 [Cytobacillus sp. NCCP-133]